MLVIADFGIGNLRSIQNMLKKIGKESRIVNTKEGIELASKIILPGMGHFDNCMKSFNESGLRSTIEEKVFNEHTPILGICVGLQMFMEGSEEGVLRGLGFIKGHTVRFRDLLMDRQLKVPNMGWLDIHAIKPSRLLKELDDSRFYFAHSFHVKEANPADALAYADYGYRYTVAVERDNIVGVQFHPEKSHKFGLQLLKNFAENY